MFADFTFYVLHFYRLEHSEKRIILSFEQFPLDARLQQTIRTAGYIELTPIQAAAIPIALTGADIIGTAQTGTGKTAAFVLPILQRLLTGPRNRHRALIV